MYFPLETEEGIFLENGAVLTMNGKVCPPFSAMFNKEIKTFIEKTKMLWLYPYL